MITEPQFPEHVITLVKTIVKNELAIDEAKAQIKPQSALSLFQEIDHLHCEEIFIEDLYAFLKRKQLVLSKKDIKFVNRYFGFSTSEALNLEKFKQKFLEFHCPSFKDDKPTEDHEQAFLHLIKLTLSSYYEIQQLRIKTTENLQELQECLRMYYPEHPHSITKDMLIEILSCINLYSRLNVRLLSYYMLGEEVKEASLKQIFWKEGQLNTIIKPEKATHKRTQTIVKELEREPPTKEDKAKGLDILTQIENVETAFKLKKQLTEQRQQKSSVQERKSTKVTGVIHRFSTTNLSTLQQQDENEPYSRLLARPGKRSHRDSEPKQPQKEYDQKQIDQILKRSLQDYNEQFQEVHLNDVERLYRKRKLSKTRQQALSRASSSAKLKIQQIEKKVLAKTRFNAYQQDGCKIPSISLNQEARSRFSSLKKR